MENNAERTVRMALLTTGDTYIFTEELVDGATVWVCPLIVFLQGKAEDENTPQYALSMPRMALDNNVWPKPAPEHIIAEGTAHLLLAYEYTNAVIAMLRMNDSMNEAFVRRIESEHQKKPSNNLSVIIGGKETKQ